MTDFHRDRMTWVLYVVAAWFAFLQAAPGLVVPHLREELGFSYSVGGLLLAAFAGGSVVAGLLSARLDALLGRTRLLWVAAAVLATGAVALTRAGAVPAAAGSIALMGAGGGLVLATVQAGLADHHGDQRAAALAEENVAAALSYLTLAGALSLAAALEVDWRLVLLASLPVPVLTWLSNRSVRIDRVTSRTIGGPKRLPGVFWVAVVILMCATAAEWCITSWGATFAQDVLDASPSTGAAMMAGYFAGVISGRALGSRLVRRFAPALLFAAALAVALVGFAVLWPSTAPAQAALGLTLLGVGLGNLFPMGLSIAVSLAPQQAAAASGRVVLMTSAAILLAPLTVGTLADATSLKLAVCFVPLLLSLAAALLPLLTRAHKHAPPRADNANSCERTWPRPRPQ